MPKAVEKPDLAMVEEVVHSSMIYLNEIFENGSPVIPMLRMEGPVITSSSSPSSSTFFPKLRDRM